MHGPLRRVLVCAPETAGWSDPERASRWLDLGYLHPPQAAAAARAHAALCAELERAGTHVVTLPESSGSSLDAVYTHDASFVTDRGAILMRMGKTARTAEPSIHGDFYRTAAISILGAIEAPGTVEGGDLVWLDPESLLVGRGHRTNAAGIDQLRALLAPLGVTTIAAPLPHGQGPGACLHLMSLLSVLDSRTLLVDREGIAVETFELLLDRSFDLIDIHPSERASLGVNVLALGDRRVLALAENGRTNRRLRESGFEVRTFPGFDLAVNGGGGPTCLTRPIRRD